MASEWPVYCQVVCSECRASTAGRFNSDRFNKGMMRRQAYQEGWRLIANDWLCKRCIERATNEQR